MVVELCQSQSDCTSCFVDILVTNVLPASHTIPATLIDLARLAVCYAYCWAGIWLNLDMNHPKPGKYAA